MFPFDGVIMNTGGIWNFVCEFIELFSRFLPVVLGSVSCYMYRWIENLWYFHGYNVKQEYAMEVALLFMSQNANALIFSCILELLRHIDVHITQAPIASDMPFTKPQNVFEDIVYKMADIC